MVSFYVLIYYLLILTILAHHCAHNQCYHYIFQDDGTIVISLPPDIDDGLDLVDGIEMSVAATSNNSEAASACVS
jgi:hypothetical protein